MTVLFQDLRFAIRTLRRRPLFTAVAVVTLGLGIGAPTAMFSVIDGVLLRPLPYSEPSRLVAIWQTVPFLQGIPGKDGRLWDRTRLTYAQYRDLLEKSTLYEDLAAYRAGSSDNTTLTGVGDAVELPAGSASASLLPLLGVHPVRGRWFLLEEEASKAGSDGASVAVVSYELWQGRFGGSAETVGSIVTFDDRPFTIVGILPPGFRVQWLSAPFSGEKAPAKRDVWFPIGAPGWAAHQNANSFETVGRLRSGVTPEQACAESSTIMSTHPSFDPDGEARVIPRMAEETHGLTSPLVLLFGATILLLIIACGNIATLSMGEVLSRRHEIAIRSALGAGAPRIVRLLLTESLVLAALGSVVGTALAFGGTSVLVALAPPIPRLHEVEVDARVLVFAVLLGTCAALLFGTLPSVLASRSSVRLSRHGPARMSLGRRGFSRTVIGMEIAMAAMLLVPGGLLTRSLSRLLAVDPGFDPGNLATVEVSLPRSRYATRATRIEFFQNALDRLKAIPGIGTVSGVSRLPFPGHTSGWNVQPLGRNQRFHALGYQVAPGYLETLGVPLLAGRGLAEADGPDAPLVVVINKTMAHRYWPAESPIGAQCRWGGSSKPITIVGIVGDVKRQVLDQDAEPTFFIPFSQHPDDSVCFVARTQREPRHIIPLMREALWSVDRKLPVKNATTVEALLAESANQQRYGTLLVSAFAILAGMLAAAGVFGVTARSVAQRTREIGIRMALGAREAGLVATTLWGTLRTCVVGTAVGLLGALWASRLLARFLYGIETSDPATYGVVAGLIVVACLLASYAPARRITKVNPVEVLKAE